MPLTHKRVTVDGNFVEKPMNIRVPIGTSVEELLDFAGIDKTRVKKALMGGPMMGVALENLDAPIIKNNNAIVLSTRTGPKHRQLPPASAAAGASTSAP